MLLMGDRCISLFFQLTMSFNLINLFNICRYKAISCVILEHVSVYNVLFKCWLDFAV